MRLQHHTIPGLLSWDFSLLRYALCVWLWCVLTMAPVYAQSDSGPYHLSWQREAVYTGSGALLLGLGTYLQSRAGKPLRSELNVQEFSQIKGIDRWANTTLREGAEHLSDFGMYGGAALTLTFLAGERTRKDFGKIWILFTEVMLINGGLTNSFKAGFLRPRPYVYGTDWDPDRPLQTGDRAAFISGHTSIAAAGSFFFARVFSDYYPDSALKPYIWGLAVVVPGLTGYLRVKAARHFPTDVIGGYLMGATIGYMVPVLHKRPYLPKGMSISPTGQGVYLSYRF